MANLGEVFKAEDLPESQDFSPLPAGTYAARVIESELKDTKAGTGQYIKLQWEIFAAGQYQGRKVFQNLNIRNPNPKAEEIGRRQMGQIMKAIGLESLQDTDQFVGGSALIKVAIKKSEEYGDSNDIKKVESYSETPPPRGDAPSAAPVTAGSSAPPWKR